MEFDKIKAAIDEWFESDESDKYFELINEQEKVRKGRYAKFTKWIEENDFDALLYRLILAHDDDYREKCYNNGCEPYPNNVLTFVFDYVFEVGNRTEVKEIESYFSDETVEFKKYYFQHIHGQGTISRIYNKEDMRLILQV